MSSIKSNGDDCPELILNLKGHKGPITSISFSPNEQIASGSEDHSVVIWNNLKTSNSYTFSGHEDVVTDVKYGKYENILVSCSQDQTVRIWVPNIYGNNSSFKAHTGAVRTVCISSDDKQLVTGSNDKSIKLWNLPRKHFITSFVGHNNWVRQVKLCPNDKLIASCSDDRTTRIWDVNTGKCVHIFTNTKGSPTSISMHRSGKYVAVASSSGSVRIYDIRTMKLRQHYVVHDHTTCVSWHPKSDFILSGGKDGKVNIIDTIEGRPLYTLGGHTGAVSSIEISPDGKYFVSGGADKHLLVWKKLFTTR